MAAIVPDGAHQVQVVDKGTPGMRAVVQRVSEAAVRVDGEVVGEIRSPGLLALLGVTSTDTARTAAAMAAKVLEN